MMRTLVRLAFHLNALWSWVVRPIRLGVRIILLQDDKVVLVRHTYMAGWHFPGGSVNRGETPLEAAAREAKEEAGAELLEPPTLLGIFTSYWGNNNDHVVFYLCRKFHLQHATDQWEIAECKLFAVDALPPQLGERARMILREHVLNVG